MKNAACLDKILTGEEGSNISGTLEGGRKAAITNKAKYGENFYSTIGAIGGKNGHTGGFFANRELARRAGAKGGTISRRNAVHLPRPDTKAQKDYQLLESRQ